MNTISKYDPYFSTRTCVDRLYGWYTQHQNLIVAFDWDDTLFDFHNKGYSYPQVGGLLLECQRLGFTLILFTSKETPEELTQVLKDVEDLCGLTVKYVNDSPVMTGAKKPYFNILLDDKAGLGQAFDVLDLTIAKIKKEIE